MAGPLPLPDLAFAPAPDPEGRKALEESHVTMKNFRPGEGDPLPHFLGPPLKFVVHPAGAALDGEGDRAAGDRAAGNRLFYAACYIENALRRSVTLEVESDLPFRLFLNGEAEGGVTVPGEGGTAILKRKLDLIAGKHAVVVKLHGSGKREAKVPRARLIPGKDATGAESTLRFVMDPTRTLARVEDALGFDGIFGPAFSSDGRLLAVGRSKKLPRPDRYVEILDIKSGTITAELRGAGSLAWRPTGRVLAYRKGGSVWTFDTATKAHIEVLRDVKGLEHYFWSSDGKMIYFLKHESAPPPGPWTRLEDPRHRLTDWDETVTLHGVNVESGFRNPLTGKGTFHLTRAALSPDGTVMALVKRIPSEGRPFFDTEFWTLDLPGGALKCVRTVRFPFENGPAGLTWSPDGKRIAFKGAPGEVKAPGEAPEHNAFDGCLWILDLENGALTRLSDRFGGSVESDPWWRKGDGKIYFIVQEGPNRRVARIDPDGEGGLEVLTEEPSVVTAMAPARDGEHLAFIGSSITYPDRLYLLNLDSGTRRLVVDPNAKRMARIRLGTFERFDFVNPEGDPVDGWIAYPPDFDVGKKYPLVVYYYGGTAPREQRFSALTYHWLAANGYVLYVVNPSGHVGYSHAMADRHCNDWGRLAGRDIMEGTRRVLAAKTFLDPKRVGCYGGSYGGFMTLHLAASCKLYRAGCSMYGISNLASYWGAGIWGYTYGDTALGGSYPWTRPDLFVGRSPLFKADRIDTALLLLHGDADVNVPVVESEQMFTALKVLGKDVAYVRFAGEDHGISGSTKNLLAHRSMLLEWFDLHLKDRPEGWNLRWKK